MRTSIILPLSVAVFAAAASSSMAATLLGPTPYLQASDSPFSTVVGFTYSHLDTLEDDALNVPGVTYDAGVVIGFEDWGGAVDSVDADDGLIDGNGNRGRSLFGGGTVTFTFNAGVLGTLPTHAGIVWTDGQTPTFEAFDKNGLSLGTVAGNPADGSHSGETAEDSFFGVINADGISSIRMTGSTWELDHLQFGAQRTTTPPPSVPEGGGSLASLLIGMLCLGGISRMWRGHTA